MSGISDFIDNEVNSNDVVLFMKGTPAGELQQFFAEKGISAKGQAA